MRIHLLSALVAGLAAHAAPALAQDSETITIQSSVTPFCANFTSSSTPLNLGDLSGPNGFLVSAFVGDTSREVAAGYYCNAPSKVTLKALPLLHTTVVTVSDATSFTNRVDYEASLTWDDVTGSVVSTVVDGVEILAAEANIGAVVIDVGAPSVTGNRRPVAGAYAGSVQLTIALQP